MIIEKETVNLRQLLPLAAPQKESDFAYPPILNLEPVQFLTQLTDHYLYAGVAPGFLYIINDGKSYATGAYGKRHSPP